MTVFYFIRYNIPFSHLLLFPLFPVITCNWKTLSNSSHQLEFIETVDDFRRPIKVIPEK